MVANSIISIILNKYKELCQRYPHAASFSASKKGNSFYLIQKRKDLPAIQIRLSNHGTYLKTWTDREELSNSTRLEDPSTCINISIVFIDNGTDITKDCKTMPNCDNCKITPCIPQTFKGQNELGTPFQVMQYVYDSSKIKSRYLNGLTRAIMMARVKGKYNDPLEKLQRAAHLKVLDSRANLPKPKVAKYERNNNKTNENKTMKKNVIRLNESQLKKIIAESVKKVVEESKGTMPRKNSEIVAKIDSTLPQDSSSFLDPVHWGSHKIDGDISDYIRRIKQGLAMIQSGIAGAAERNGVWEKEKYQPMVDSIVKKVSFIMSNLRKNAYMLNDANPNDENEYTPNYY